MNGHELTPHRCIALAISAAILALGALRAAPAWSADLLGLYLGGAVGQAQVEAGNLPSPLPPAGSSTTFGDFKKDHSAFKILAGLRPISLLGAEIDYFDFGHPGQFAGTIPSGIVGIPGFPVTADVRMRGSAAFGVLYLPVPIVDVYVKAGAARLQTTANTTVTVSAPFATCVVQGGPNCQFSKQYDVTTTGLAAGVGAQLKFGSVAVRAEYERYNAAGSNPGLVSLGLTWTFL